MIIKNITKKNAKYYSIIGKGYNYIQKYNEAEEHYLKAIQLDPNDHWILIYLGDLYKKIKQYDKAI